MADKDHSCLLGLILLCPLLTADENMFCSSGEDVHVPCNNAFSKRNSTTWNYSRSSKTVELIGEGTKKKNIERHERLSLGSECSLNINNVTKEDYGSYVCQQFVNRQKQGSDSRVFLHVLHVSPSSKIEIIPGLFLTLSCQLYSSYGVYCDGRDGFELFWVNQTGVNLKTDSRYQISSSPGKCISHLTTKLLNEEDHRELRCQLAQRNQVKTSARYMVKKSVMGISVLAAVFAIFIVALLLVIWRKRASNKRGTVTEESVSKDGNEGIYETIYITSPPAARANDNNKQVTCSAISNKQKMSHKMNLHL